MQIISYGMTDLGRHRIRNEDAFLVSEPLSLFVVADGMGGHLGGEYASHLAVNTIEEVVKVIAEDPDATLSYNIDFTPGDPKSLLRYSIQTASRRIFAKSLEDSSLRGMGTTVVVALFQNNTLYLANVGDSRGYLIRGKRIKQITVDHSLVEEQVRAGVISLNEAKNHRFKNVITRSVGFQEDVIIDVITHKSKPGDRYLLCTDGLSNMISDKEIYDVVINNSLKDSCSRLVELANERGGDDNITVVMAEVKESEAGENNLGEPTLEE